MTQPPSAPTSGGRGPLGEARNPGQVAILSLITCGIYMVYWAYLTFEELKRHTGEGLGGVGAALFLVIVGPFILNSEIQKMYEADGRQSPVEPVHALFLWIPLAGLFIYTSKVQTALNDYWVSKGAQPAA